MGSHKTILIIGAGPQLGMAVARRFGREGYSAALVSRSQDKLDAYAKELKAEGIDSAGFAADVADLDALAKAVDRALERFGRIDAIEFSPLIAMGSLVPPDRLQVDDVLYNMRFHLLGAITVVNKVLPGMLERGEGVLLFTTGASAVAPLASHCSASLAVTALRHYAYMLNDVLEGKGIYAGTISIAKIHDPQELAERYWQMAKLRDRVEYIDGAIDEVAAYESYVSREVALGYPRLFIAEPPAPRNDKERLRLLLALAHSRGNAQSHLRARDDGLLLGAEHTRGAPRLVEGGPKEYVARLDALARQHGGDPADARYGVEVGAYDWAS